MSTESIILLTNATDDSQPLIWQYSDKNKAAGYHKNNSGVHTAIFSFDNFKGSVKIQATLELYPEDTDWFDVVLENTETGVTLDSIDSTPLTTNTACNFTGKFVFIRAAYKLEEGTISEIRYNY